MNVIERFMDKVHVEPNTGCWLWGASTVYGYGSFYREGTGSRRAHRAAYELFVGKIPDGGVIMHRCDVRCCVNPEHLSVGSHEDNNADMTRKGRRAVGERHADAKLTEEQVRDIWSRPDESLVDLGREYGVHPNTIGAIRRGWSWCDVTGLDRRREP